MSVPVLDLRSHHADLLPQFVSRFQAIAAEGAFVLGEEVSAFEAELATYCAAAQAVGVSSGTDALLAALMALGIGPGDEVITTAFTFFATAGSIARVGARPVFVDIDPATFNIDPAQIESAVTAKTVAIMPVHLYGLPANMTAIIDIANRRNLKVIADAAQAIGARHGDQPVGGLGDVVCLSFYPTKNLSAMGDAGACLTNDAGLAEKLRKTRLHGGGRQYFHETIGGNFRIDALQAAMLRIKLPHLQAWTAARRAVADRYRELLADVPVTLPAPASNDFHVYHQFTIRVPAGRRDALVAHLRSREVGCGVYYPLPLHLQPCFDYLKVARGALPHTEQASDEVLSLPIYPELTQSQQAEVAAALHEFYH